VENTCPTSFMLSYITKELSLSTRPYTPIEVNVKYRSEESDLSDHTVF
jgi:hypothetical protein